MAEPLKNLYNRPFFEDLAAKFVNVEPTFSSDRFLELIFDEEWEAKELKDRLRHVTQCIKEVLGKSYRESLEILKPVAAQCEPDFTYMFFPDFVELYGLDDFEASVDVLAHFTCYSSSEFAVRPFIVRYPAEMMQVMLKWTDHENHHVRRLASEGCRPRLPWAMALPDFKKDPTPILPILEKLKADPSDYVRKSVANNLNDISKDNPDSMLAIVKRWKGHHAHTDWIVKHACRGLLKSAHPEALKLFGFGDVEAVAVVNLKLSRDTLAIGEELEFSFDVVNSNPTESKLRIEYKVHYMKASGKQMPKVFIITENTFAPGSTAFVRKQSFQDFTTRKHYPGEHKLEIVVNGVGKAIIPFVLTQ